MTDSGADLISTPIFTVGVCSGTSNVFGDATVTNYCGIISQTATWTRNASPLGYVFTDNFRACKKAGTTLTVNNTSNGVNGSLVILSDKRSAMAVDITKGSPNYTFEWFYNGATNPTEPTSAVFRGGMEAAVAVLSSHSYGNARTLAVDQNAGSFDTVNIHWDRTAATIDIDDLYIVRLA